MSNSMSDQRGVGMKFILSVLMMGLGATAVAQQDESLEVRTVVQKEEIVVTADGSTERRLVPAEAVIPGEQVFYTITFKNVGAAPAENVVITNPIAAELRYVDGSAFGPGSEVQFSVDGGKSFAAAADLTVTEAGETRPATAEDFTHIRWKLRSDLATGSQGTARFAAVLN